MTHKHLGADTITLAHSHCWILQKLGNSSQAVVMHTCQESFNEHSTLGLQLAVEMAKDCPDHPKHSLEVGLLQRRLTGGVQQVLQLCHQQLAHPHQQRMLKRWYSPAVLCSVIRHWHGFGTICSALCVVHCACLQQILQGSVFQVAGMCVVACVLGSGSGLM